MLGYPEAALADTEQALKDAREIGQAATLMFALAHAWLVYLQCAGSTPRQPRWPTKATHRFRLLGRPGRRESVLNRECFIVRDHDSHALACVYFEDVVDRHAAIPEVSIWTAAEDLPVKAKAGVASAPDSGSRN